MDIILAGGSGIESQEAFGSLESKVEDPIIGEQGIATAEGFATRTGVWNEPLSTPYSLWIAV